MQQKHYRKMSGNHKRKAQAATTIKSHNVFAGYRSDDLEQLDRGGGGKQALDEREAKTSRGGHASFHNRNLGVRP